MTFKGFLELLGRSVDPKRDLNQDAPRALLVAKLAVEYVFKITGFFVLLCVIVGMSLAACSDNMIMANLPFVLGFLFSFYIVLTTLGIPVYFLIHEIENIRTRRVVGYGMTLLLFLLTFLFFAASPIFSLLLTYVHGIFPEAFECSSGFLKLGDGP